METLKKVFGLTRKNPLSSRPPNARNNSGNALLNGNSGNFSLKNPRFANLRSNKLKQLAMNALPQVESLYNRIKANPTAATNQVIQQQKTIRNNLKKAFEKLQSSGNGNYTNQLTRLSAINYESFSGVRGSNASSVSMGSQGGGSRRRKTRRNRRCFCRR